MKEINKISTWNYVYMYKQMHNILRSSSDSDIGALKLPTSYHNSQGFYSTCKKKSIITPTVHFKGWKDLKFNPTFTNEGGVQRMERVSSQCVVSSPTIILKKQITHQQVGVTINVKTRTGYWFEYHILNIWNIKPNFKQREHKNLILNREFPFSGFEWRILQWASDMDVLSWLLVEKEQGLKRKIYFNMNSNGNSTSYTQPPM